MPDLRERAREVLLVIDPYILLDDGPHTLHQCEKKDGWELCGHAPGYHMDPYGILFRTNARLSETLELLGGTWDIAEGIPEIERLLNRTMETLEGK